MFSHSTRLQYDRIQADAAALEQLRQCLGRVRDAQNEGHARLLDAQRAVDVLSRASQELESAEQALSMSLAEARRELFQQSAARIPDDIWRCIFEEAVQEDSGSRVAFILARVSARWRRIVLSTPRLWSRIGFPKLETVGAKQLDTVKLMLSRSGDCSLDIKIWWYDNCHDQDHLVQPMRDILSALSDQTHRWRVASLVLLGRIGRRALVALKGPTPKLARLCISIRSCTQWASEVETGYLPYAPMLKTLVLCDTMMSCSAASAYPVLTDVALAPGQDVHPSQQILGFISRARESLHKVEITTWLDHSAGALGPVLLPQLQTLVLVHAPQTQLNNVPAVTRLSTPCLTKLVLRCDTMPAVPVSFLAAVSSTVRTLEFFDVLTADALGRLRHLENIERVIFGMSIEDDAYAALTTHVPPIWPRLTVVDMRYLVNDCVPDDALLGLITSRNVARPEGGAEAEQARPCRLQEVILGPSAPRWVSAEVERLLAL
ncbi:hypothetical protein AURDEDRAFT_175319 [Auricularia subglabra TFB-10046 SS5]|nr:hypothetical protein AURDEDRAFT_175319 [Auricularia subglabra TFB-10046 SS5]